MIGTYSVHGEDVLVGYINRMVSEQVQYSGVLSVMLRPLDTSVRL